MDRGLFVKLRARVAAEGRQYLGAASQTVVEALENVESDDLVIAACERPKIFRLYDRGRLWRTLADIPKVDFGRTTPG